MKKWFISLGLLVACAGFLSSTAMGQMMGGGQQMGGGPGGFPPPPEISVSELSPDGKLIYIYTKGTLFQYLTADMTLKNSVLVDSSAQFPMRGGPPMMCANSKMLFSHDGKRMFIVQGRSVYLYETEGLKFLSRTLMPDSGAATQSQASPYSQ